MIHLDQQMGIMLKILYLFRSILGKKIVFKSAYVKFNVIMMYLIYMAIKNRIYELIFKLY